MIGSALEHDRIIDPVRRDRVVDYVARALPGLVPEPYAETTCLFTNAPDDDFIIDRVEGITILSPCSGHGAKFAPLLGDLAARLVTGRRLRRGPIPPPRCIGRRMTRRRRRCIEEISSIGRDSTRGGFSRAGYSRADRELRDWFISHAERRELDVERDRNGILWAWWNPAGATGDAIVTGSHLDSVPGGGGYDGPLGVASALAAIDILREDRVKT